MPQGVDSIIIRELADRHCDQTKYRRPLKVNNVPSRWLDLTGFTKRCGDDRMSAQPRPDRSVLLKEFRNVLVDEWPERVSMETILGDAGLDARRYIVDALRADDRWAQAIRRIDRDNKLIKLIIVVREYFDQENIAIEQLYAAEHADGAPATVTQELDDPAAVTSGPPSADRIFISYRRDDTAYPAGWLYDKLVDHFGQAQVFKDIDSILLGDDFVEKITTAVGSCAVLLALIGNRWLTVTDNTGRRCFPDDPWETLCERRLKRHCNVMSVSSRFWLEVRGCPMPPSCHPAWPS